MTNRGRPLPIPVREQIWFLASTKMPKIQIARAIGLSNKTVIKYLKNKFTQVQSTSG